MPQITDQMLMLKFWRKKELAVVYIQDSMQIINKVTIKILKDFKKDLNTMH